MEPDLDSRLEVDRDHAISARLRRFRAKGDAKGTAALFGGGNSSADTFLVPDGGLARHLVDQGWDVWLVDWRGSPHLIKPLLQAGALCGVPPERPPVYTHRGGEEEHSHYIPRILRARNAEEVY